MNKRLTLEQENLVFNNMGLIHHVLKKSYYNCNNGSYDYDDLKSIGTIALIKAAKTFDPNKKTKFATYAITCIYNELYGYFKYEKLHTYDNIIYLDSSITNSDENKVSCFYDIIPSDIDFTKKFEEDAIFTDIINIVLNLLKSKERLVMLYTIAGTKQNNIANTLNISRSYVTKLKKDSYKKIRSYLEETFKKVFSMAIIGDFYQISIDTQYIKHSNKIFARFIQNLISTQNLPNFKVYLNEERVIVTVPAQLESFFFIAQLIQEIDD